MTEATSSSPGGSVAVTTANHLYGRMIAYHWSPSLRQRAIEEQGLIIGAAPAVNAVQDSHRNPWISVSPTPSQAWWLSGGALEVGGLLDALPGSSLWLLWEVDITGLLLRGDIANYPEYRVLENIATDRITLIGQRSCGRLADKSPQVRRRAKQAEVDYGQGERYSGVAALFNADLHRAGPLWAPREDWLVLDGQTLQYRRGGPLGPAEWQ